ncbi:MAG: AI-2E family transporter [Bdellovibrionales bacterium]
MTIPAEKKIEIASYLLAGIGLFLILDFGLLVGMLAGLLVYNLVEFGSRGLARLGVLPAVGRVALFVVITVGFISAVVFGVVSLVSSMANGSEGLGALLTKMAEVVETIRGHLPPEINSYLPSNMADWQVTISSWLRSNAKELGSVGHDVGVVLFRLVAGMIIGGLVGIHGSIRRSKLRPLSQALHDRFVFLGVAFRRIVFSQIRISALNTALTAIFLLLILPLLGEPPPLAKTLIVVTFVAGLLPIIGNLISNTAITLIVLSVSLKDALCALAFLVIIHKLEYFVNARIVGGQIRAHAWEILSAMVIMEAIFGIPGLVAAPIYYAYVKDELTAKGLT